MSAASAANPGLRSAADLAAGAGRGFGNIHATLPGPASAPKPGKPGSGRPPGSKNRRPAPRYDVGKTTKREPTLKARRERAG
jgi:hypothetical protein